MNCNYTLCNKNLAARFTLGKKCKNEYGIHQRGI